MPERQILLPVLLAAATAAAETLTDPTRPPGGAARAVSGHAPASAWRLEGIFLGPGGAFARIDGRLLAVGARIGGARVTRIEPHRVWLTLPDGTRRQLSLVRPGAVRPRAKAGGSGREEERR